LSPQTTVRSFTESDLDWVVENERELHACPWTRRNFVDALEAGYATRIMCIDASPVAYAVMLQILDEIHLLNLSVIRASHRQGIGSDFLRRLENEARDAGARQFFLEVRPSNEAALTLYRHHGFISIGRRARYYPSDDGDREDAIVMRLAL
jgi:ribosomal-protein-alanine N-acetyltransferase